MFQVTVALVSSQEMVESSESTGTVLIIYYNWDLGICSRAAVLSFSNSMQFSRFRHLKMKPTLGANEPNPT